MGARALPQNTFVEFGSVDRITSRLRAIEVYHRSMEPLFAVIAERLSLRAYDRSAFVFILIEVLYESEEDATTLGDLLGRFVYALTEDLELVGEALDTFEEVRQTIEPSTIDEPELPPTPLPEDEEEAWEPGTEHEYLMLELQLGQKRVIDLGLSARLSIEMSLARPNRENVRQTLREISILRSNLSRFEELLRTSEEHILEAIGFLGKD